eukprot:CAMPEP_0181201740 /NCGR_PEP_ID=MMETSP1096-20121128/18465_1 /TAXON_ID=156174 ORGANISM="Chrysochromulina ericina, Strain CCMP281" /NCGR_SAMPLE_ID=MMETSP1096 /ASSEMBLY_ACC=CAM_ASM_000453 /LENGTH=145 /DNA_ID=CAMNT_0023292197 /DNA_START=727 /DNA_END=1165 /DNA_ORIENTATION=-
MRLEDMRSTGTVADLVGRREPRGQMMNDEHNEHKADGVQKEDKPHESVISQRATQRRSVDDVADKTRYGHVTTDDAIPMAAVVRVVSSPYDERSESVLEYNAQTPIPAPIVHIHSTCSELGMLIMTPTLTTSSARVGTSKVPGVR